MPFQIFSVDTSILPDNVLNLVDDDFYKVVEVVAGPIEAKLLEIQGIRSVYSFLNTDDTFGILTFKCSTISNIKKSICFEIDDNDDNTIMIKPGCRSNIRYLHQLLSQKHDEHMKKYKYKYNGYKQSQSINNTTSLNLSQNLSQASSTPATQQQAIGASGAVDQIDHRAFIIKKLNEWSVKNLTLNNQTLIEDQDFKLRVSQGASEGICIICGCQAKFNLTRVRRNFSLSNYYKHLKSDKCEMIKKKKEININNHNRLDTNGGHDSSDDDEISDVDSSPQRKRLRR